MVRDWSWTLREHGGFCLVHQTFPAQLLLELLFWPHSHLCPQQLQPPVTSLHQYLGPLEPQGPLCASRSGPQTPGGNAALPFLLPVPQHRRPFHPAQATSMASHIRNSPGRTTPPPLVHKYPRVPGDTVRALSRVLSLGFSSIQYSYLQNLAENWRHQSLLKDQTKDPRMASTQVVCRPCTSNLQPRGRGPSTS